MSKPRAFIVAAGSVALCLSAAALIPASADLRPKQALLIRHAEEPKDGPGLNDEGRARAQMLAQWIPATFGTVDYLFAAKNSKQSSRSVETLEPLSAKTGLVIDQRFDDAEFEELVKLLRTPAYSGKTVVVCWHSEQLPRFARSLGAEKAPSDWPSKGRPEQFRRAPSKESWSRAAP